MTPDDKPLPQSSIPDPQSGTSVDVPKESPRTILFQFVFFPLGIVAVAVLVFFLFGRLASDEQGISDYLNEVQSGGRRERWQAAYQLSQLINAGEAKKQPNLVEQVIGVYRNSKDDDPRIRRYLSMVLGNLGDKRATPLLIEALAEKDVETRIYASLALGRLKDPAAVPHLLNAFSTDERDVRKAAAYALGEIGDPRGVPALAAALNDPIADVRFNSAVALARFGDRRAIGVIREMLDRNRLASIPGMRDDQKEAILLTAMPALLRLAPEEAKTALKPIADSDPSMQVRSAAKEALQKL